MRILVDEGDRGGGGGLGEEGHVRGECQAVRPRRQAREGHRPPQQTPLTGQSHASYNVISVVLSRHGKSVDTNGRGPFFISWIFQKMHT